MQPASPHDARTTPASNPSEVEAFRALQVRLREMWSALETRPDFHHASVVVPSLSLDAEELGKIPGVSFYEERLLFILMRLRHPAARVLYVTSLPIPAEIVDYYLDLLTGVPTAHARGRLRMLCVCDSTARPLTEKILERPRVLARMRDWIGDPERAYLTCFNSSPLERTLAVKLGVPLNGMDPDLADLGSKSGSRKIFRAAGVPCPAGFEDVRGAAEVVERLTELGRMQPDLRRAVVKLNSSFSGEGNATFTFPPEGRSRADVEAALRRLEFTAANETYDGFFARMERLGGIVEAFVDPGGSGEITSPSVQMRITPTREVTLVSTHDQVLGGSTGQAYAGCRFPARAEYRELLQEAAFAIARELRDAGVISRFAIDFMAWRPGPEQEWRITAIELNLRLGGTTFPFLALEFLTDGRLDPASGLFRSASGDAKYYVATDALKDPRFRGLLPEDLLDIMIECGLIFDPTQETGVLFHMIGALSQFGKLGAVFIGDSPEHAQELLEETRRVLQRATDPSGEADTAPLPPPARRLD